MVYTHKLAAHPLQAALVEDPSAEVCTTQNKGFFSECIGLFPDYTGVFSENLGLYVEDLSGEV